MALLAVHAHGGRETAGGGGWLEVLSHAEGRGRQEGLVVVGA